MEGSVMDFLPIKYAAGTLTKWHFGIWIFLSLLLPLLSIGSVPLEILVGNAAIMANFVAMCYLIFAPMVGQSYGDKYSWSQVWPTAFFIALVIAAIFCLNFARADPDFPLSSAIAFLIFGTVWFGICLSLMMWLLPKAAAWDPKRYPKKPWGVSL
jgi:hypothetical protein